VKVVQLLQIKEVAELRWDGAIELILGKDPKKIIMYQ